MADAQVHGGQSGKLGERLLSPVPKACFLSLPGSDRLMSTLNVEVPELATVVQTKTTATPPPSAAFVPGLEGVVAFHTALPEPDKDGGSLRYRGVDTEDLLGRVGFEDVWS